MLSKFLLNFQIKAFQTFRNPFFFNRTERNFVNLKIDLYRRNKQKKKKKKEEYYFQYRGNRNGSCSRERHKQEQVTSTPIAIGGSLELFIRRLQNWLRHFHSRKCSSINRTMRVYIAACTSRSQDFDEDRDYGIRIESSGVKSLLVLETTFRFRPDREIEANQGYNKERRLEQRADPRLPK